MPRYLLFISYLGTRFRGVQKQVSSQTPQFDDPFTVQGMLEIALKRFRPLQHPGVVLSSRTDAGVHALRSSVHVDLEKRVGSYKPLELMGGINKYFHKSDVAIRVQECKIVPDTFHVRGSVLKRSYLYRLAVRKRNAQPPSLNTEFATPIPFYEWRRCHFVQNSDFDVEKFKSAAQLLPGLRDFRTFIGKLSPNKRFPEKEISTVRLLHNINIFPGQSLQNCPFSLDYNYWDIVCCGKSFGYRQVRRMVGVLLAVAQGKLLHSDVEHMLAEPCTNSWKPCVVIAPAYGLYLLNVEYDPTDLILDSNTQIELSEKKNAPDNTSPILQETV